MQTQVLSKPAYGTKEHNADLYHKIIWRLIPFLCFCYLAAYLDRINVGFAKLQMLEDLQFSETAYGLGAGLFFVGYILFEVPSNLVLEKVGARVWIARIMISWGILSALTMFVTTPNQFYIVRFLLGSAEAGFLPGVLYYLTTWFPSYKRGKIIALFMIGLPLSSVIGGPLSGWIMSSFDELHGLRGWQWLFLLESIPSIILGVLTFWALPDNYKKAKWLNDEEKALLKADLDEDNAEAKDSKQSFKDGFFNIKVWMLGSIDFAILLGAYAIGFWMPTFIRNTGVVDTFDIGLLTAIPSIAGVICMLAIGASSDRHRERRWHLCIPLLIGAAALTASTFVATNTFMTVLTFTIASGALLGAVPVFFSLPATFLKGTAAATAFALACSLANIAGLVSNSLIGWATDITGTSYAALWLFSACLVLNAFLSLVFPAKLVNR